MSDGNLDSGWASGQDSNLNISITAGSLSEDGSTFNQNTFGAINDIRIWTQYVAYSYPNQSSPWEGPVSQIKVIYSMTTNTAASGGSWWGNGSILNGPNTGIWNYSAPITAVNGAPVTADSNGFVDLTPFETSANLGAVEDGFGAFGNSTGVAYPVQLSVAIPAGATSVVFEFGNVDWPVVISSPKSRRRPCPSRPASSSWASLDASFFFDVTAELECDLRGISFLE